MKILNYGSMNIDNVYQVEHMVHPGETQMAIAKNVFAGGKGSTSPSPSPKRAARCITPA